MSRKSNFALVLLVALCGCKQEVSGTYIAKDASGVVLLQIVRTPDNHLTGQMVVSQIGTSGAVDRRSVSLTGAVDGENLTLTGGGLFGVGTATMSGVLDGDKLTLATSLPQPIILERTSLSDYQSNLQALDKQSHEVLDAKAQEANERRAARDEVAFVNSANSVIAAMQHFDSVADVHLSKLPVADKEYDDLTAKMERIVEREKQLASQANTSYTRSQLVYAANQLSYNTEQVHYQVQSVESDLKSDGKSLFETVGVLEQRCAVGLNTTVAARQNACNNFKSANPQFQDRYRAMVTELGHLEQTYTAQKATQEQLLKTANRLE